MVDIRVDYEKKTVSGCVRDMKACPAGKVEFELCRMFEHYLVEWI